MPDPTPHDHDDRDRGLGRSDDARSASESGGGPTPSPPVDPVRPRRASRRDWWLLVMFASGVMTLVPWMIDGEADWTHHRIIPIVSFAFCGLMGVALLGTLVNTPEPVNPGQVGASLLVTLIALVLGGSGGDPGGSGGSGGGAGPGGQT